MGEHSFGGALAPYRVLDLTDEQGLLCGRVLADMGADVVVVEPVRGNTARRLGPFYHGAPHPERSLFWYALNVNKRSVTLNLETANGQDIFKRLVKTADFVVESYPPGYMDGFGLGYGALSRINPGLVMTSITPFGQTGPYRDFKATDLTLMAMGGLTLLSGEPDRPPLRIPVPQAYFQAGTWAATASLVAFHHRQTNGDGQHVDVSIQQVATWAAFVTPAWWSYAKRELGREGTWRQIGAARTKTIFRCADGHVALLILGGVGATLGQWRLVEWLEAEGLCPESLRGLDWSKFDVTVASQEFFDTLSEALGALFSKRTMLELFDWARKNDLSLAPTLSVKDLVASPQLLDRGFFVEVDYPELGSAITHPGPFAQMSETPIVLTRRPPLIGEHNKEIFGEELGFSAEELSALSRTGVI